MPRKPGLEFSRWTSRCRSPSASSSCRSSTGWTPGMRHATSARPERSTSWGAPAPHRGDGTARMQIDRRVFELYDEYCHGRIDRREFLARAGALTVAGVSALAMAQALLPRYAQAQTVSFTDERMKAQYVNYPSPGGNSGSMRGYLARPAGRSRPGQIAHGHAEQRALSKVAQIIERQARRDRLLLGRRHDEFPSRRAEGRDARGGAVLRRCRRNSRRCEDQGPAPDPLRGD